MFDTTNSHSNDTNAAAFPRTPEAHQRADGGEGKAPTTGFVPLFMLRHSPRNVRTVRDGKGIEELAALIHAQGLLQPLGVTEDPKQNDVYLVEFGGRRLDALEWLAVEGKLPADHLVECRLYDADRATEISLAENSGREEMHPADQMEAFRRLIDGEGLTVERVAARFGVSVLTVHRRLKLAKVAPALLDLYRAQQINEQQLQALALTDDQELQVQVWESADRWDRDAHSLRSRIVEQELPEHHRLCRFVGVEAYRAAGGAVRTDLFAEAGGGVYLCDSALVTRLADAKLAEAAAGIEAEGWAWVSPRVTLDTSELYAFSRLRPTLRKLTAEEKAESDQLEKVCADAQAAIDEAYESDDDSEEEKINELENVIANAGPRMQAIEAARQEYTKKARKSAGVVVTVAHDGSLRVERGLMSKEDVRAAAKNPGSSADGEDDEGEGGGGVNFSDSGRRAARGGVSDKLLQDLTAHRTAAMQAALLANPHVALCAMVEQLCQKVFTASYSQRGPVQVSVELCGSTLARSASDFESSPASQALCAAEAEWQEVHALVNGEHDDQGALLRWLIDQPGEAVLRLLAYLTARSLNVVQMAHCARDEGAPLAAALALDMRQWWAPSATTYFQHVSKAQIVEAVAEAAGADVAAPLAKMKKGEAATAAAAMVEGKGWLPIVLRG